MFRRCTHIAVPDFAVRSMRCTGNSRGNKTPQKTTSISTEVMERYQRLAGDHEMLLPTYSPSLQSIVLMLRYAEHITHQGYIIHSRFHCQSGFHYPLIIRDTNAHIAHPKSKSSRGMNPHSCKSHASKCRKSRKKKETE